MMENCVFYVVLFNVVRYLFLKIELGTEKHLMLFKQIGSEHTQFEVKNGSNAVGNIRQLIAEGEVNIVD